MEEPSAKDYEEVTLIEQLNRTTQNMLFSLQTLAQFEPAEDGHEPQGAQNEFHGTSPSRTTDSSKTVCTCRRLSESTSIQWTLALRRNSLQLQHQAS